MTERPILFGDAMVRAILDGRKTQTRRVVKGFPLDLLGEGFTPEYVAHPNNNGCHYGQPGDRLWVREAWSSALGAADLTPREIVAQRWPIWYRANGDRYFLGASEGGPAFTERENRWRPSIHMPREASRLVLEVTGVRVERLQDISEADAKAEGIVNHRLARNSYAVPGMSDGHYLATAREAFEALWSSINGPKSWDASPWVLVVEFRRLPC